MSLPDGIKLFYAVPDFFPPWRLDVRELFAVQLQNMGVQVTWSARRGSQGRCIVDEYLGRPVWLPLRLGVPGKVGKALNKLLQYACEIAFFMRLLFGQNYDIVQARDRRYFFAFLLWLVARIRGWRFTYWLSYPYPEFVRETADESHGIARWIYAFRAWLSWRYLYRFMFRVADHVFVQSDQMLRDVSSYGVPAAKMTPVPMGVPPGLLDMAGDDSKELVDAGKVVYLGTLARVRRMSVLIDAFRLVRRRNPNAYLVMVGDGDTPDERAELEALARQHGLVDAVIFTGFIPMEDAWRHAATAQVCVSPFYPSFVLRSTSPTKLNEYFALGRPVVANDHPEQSRAIAESGAGVCVPWGVDDFAEGILKLLENPQEAEAMAVKGPGWVRENRTYDRIAGDILSQYRKLVGLTN